MTEENSTDPSSEKSPSNMPRAGARPRDGVYRSYHLGTDQPLREGPMVAGKAHGRWREWHANGQLARELTYERGLAEGAETLWHESGAEKARGESRAGLREGLWVFHHPNGAHSHSVAYEAGKRTGPYKFYLEDGTLRAEGQFADDLRTGPWFWYGDDDCPKREQHYRRGAPHGLSQGWDAGGQLRYRRHYDNTHDVGVHETWGPDGSLTRRLRYDSGSRLLERVEVVDGEERIERPVFGIADELLRDEKHLKKLLAKIHKAKDDSKKRDALGELVPANQRGALILHAYRRKIFALPKEPSLFELLVDLAEHISGEELLRLLAEVTLPEGQRFGVPAWTSSLDRLVIEVFSRDPEPILAGFRELPPPMRRGVAFALARCREELVEGMRAELGDLTDTLAAVNDGWLPEALRWPARAEEGSPRRDEVTIHRGYRPTAHFSAFFALYGDEEAFRAKLLELAKQTVAAKQYLSLPLFSLALERAPLEALPALIDRTREQQDGPEWLERLFLEWRSDSAEQLIELALALYPDGSRQWVAIAAAIVRSVEEGRAIDPRLVEALRLPRLHPQSRWIQRRIDELPEAQRFDPSFRDEALRFADEPLGELPHFHHRRLIFRALRALPEEAVAKLVEGSLETQSKNAVPPFLFLVDDPKLWERALAALDGEASDALAMGLGQLPLEALPLLRDARERSSHAGHRAALLAAMVAQLARAASRGEPWDEAWDPLIRLALTAKDGDAEWSAPLVAKAYHHLPVERAEALLLSALDPAQGVPIERALALLPIHPTERLLQAGFSALVAAEDRIPSGAQRPLGDALRGIADVEQWIEWLLRRGAGSRTSMVLENAVGGSKRLAQLREATSGGT